MSSHGGNAGEVAASFYTIGEAASLTGVSQGLLRLWEREGLISPQRTHGGHRYYTHEDVLRLHRIANLRKVGGLNIAGIRRELGLADPAPNLEISEIRPELGRRLRELRTDRQLSLTNVAQRTGLSTSFLSAVERGQASISLANLFKLADAYGTTVPGLNASVQQQQRKILRPEERPHFVDKHGLVVIEDLIARPGALEAQRIEVLPGGGSEEAYSHPGEEFIYVLSGQLDFWIDESEHYQLSAGDSLYFLSTQLHRWRNEQEQPTVVLWMNVPLVEPAPGGVSQQQRGKARRRPRLCP